MHNISEELPFPRPNVDTTKQEVIHTSTRTTYEMRAQRLTQGAVYIDFWCADHIPPTCSDLAISN